MTFRACSSCCASGGSSLFSTNQRKKSNAERRCKQCVAAPPPPPPPPAASAVAPAASDPYAGKRRYFVARDACLREGMLGPGQVLSFNERQPLPGVDEKVALRRRGGVKLWLECAPEQHHLGVSGKPRNGRAGMVVAVLVEQAGSDHAVWVLGRVEWWWPGHQFSWRELDASSGSPVGGVKHARGAKLQPRIYALAQVAGDALTGALHPAGYVGGLANTPPTPDYWTFRRDVEQAAAAEAVAAEAAAAPAAAEVVAEQAAAAEAAAEAQEAQEEEAERVEQAEPSKRGAAAVMKAERHRAAAQELEAALKVTITPPEWQCSSVCRCATSLACSNTASSCSPGGSTPAAAAPEYGACTP
jgi:hypothetical protein